MFSFNTYVKFCLNFNNQDLFRSNNRIFSLDNAKVGFNSQNMSKKIKIPCVPSTQDGTRDFFFTKTATCSSGLQVPINFYFSTQVKPLLGVAVYDFFFFVNRYSEQRFIMKTDICLPLYKKNYIQRQSKIASKYIFVASNGVQRQFSRCL